MQVPESPGNEDSRQKMVRSATLLLREQGYTGTSFGDVVAASGAPRGSIYHHFPGGKTEMIREAVAYAGEYADKMLERASRDHSPEEVVNGFIAVIKKTMVANDFRAGCPVAAVAVEDHPEAPELEKAASDVFASWTSTLAASLRRSGVPAARARRLATLAVTSVEGAIMLCRASRDTRALDDVGQELAGLYRAAVPEPAQ